MFNVSIDWSGFRRAVARTKQDLTLGVQRAVISAAHDASAEAKRVGRFINRTGYLRNTIHAAPISVNAEGAVYEVVAPAPYAAFVEAGTKPHRIEPRNASVLRWEADGAVHFARGVHHPGSRAFPFFGPAFLKAEAVLDRDIRVLMQSIGDLWQ